MNIRKIFAVGVAILAICALSVPAAFSQPVPGGTLDPLTIPKYVQPLVIPPVMESVAANDYEIAVREFHQQILPGAHWNAVSPACIATPGLCNFPATKVWSYGPANDVLPDSSDIPGGAVGLAPALNSQFNYPAFTIENTVNIPTTVDWENDLRANFGTGAFLPYLIPGVVDQTLHWANPVADCANAAVRTDCRGTSQVPYVGPNPIITHVHGAHVGPESDGYPEAWYLPDPASGFTCVPAAQADPAAGKYVCEGTLANGYGAANTNVTPGVANFSYPNTQPSTTLWYHDHTLGMTRLNVYAGPAGYWLIREAGGGETGLDETTYTLPGPAPVFGEDPNFTAADRAKVREIPIVIQDRSFNSDGSLFYPADRAFFEGINPNQLKIPFIGDPAGRPSDISPVWNPEAFFNTMVVNGTTWPVLNVAQAKYRFRLLNGCNSRFLNLSMFVVDPGTNQITAAEIPFYQIGAEQSLLPAVVEVRTGFKNDATPANGPDEALLMGLAERADVIVDFEGLTPGTRVRMINTAPDAPFGGFPDIPADPGTTGQVMEFVVDAALNGASDTDPSGATPATDPMALVFDANPGGVPLLGALTNTTPRDLALLEEESALVCINVRPNGTVNYDKNGTPADPPDGTCIDKKGRLAKSVPFAPKAAVLGINGSGGPIGPGGSQVTLWSDPIETNPALNAIEEWELWNWSADAHPIHLHLVKFEVLNRGVIQLAGPTVDRDPELTEAGWKDTVIAYPGEVTRLKAKFDIAGLYVWHCHIVEHEDNEMMVPYCVGDKATAPGCSGL